jgi:hypothetical protein
MRKFILFFFCLLVNISIICAQKRLFDSNQLLKITLIAKFDSLLYNDNLEVSTYSDALLLVPELKDTFHIRVRTRGKFRRKEENCSFPPLKIKFNKKETRHSIFSKIDNLKLVSHCQSDPLDFQDYVLREYLMYRFYNRLSDSSFRVRLLEITYIDSAGLIDTLIRYGFFIENEKNMAKRLDLKVSGQKSFVPSPSDFNSNLLALFNFMIVNQDYSFELSHNLIVLSDSATQQQIPVPFDFDFAGMVDIPYNIPRAENDTMPHYWRNYKGFCRSLRKLKPTIAYFNNHKEELYDELNSFSQLSEESKQSVRRKLDEFYSIINNRKLSRKYFSKRK